MADQLKIVCRPSFDEMYVESESGYMLANLYRSAKMADGDVEVIVGDDCCSLAAHNVTTEEQWRGICDLFAAAPEMLAVLRDLRATLEVLTGWRELDGTQIDQLIASDGLHYLDKVIAKAEPPRKVKKRLLVSVEVEVEADSDATLDVFKTRALDSVYTGGGVCVSFKGKTVTTLGELYEE
jgi:hypothetical protein